MSRVEKVFVNGGRHARRVANRAEQLVASVEPARGSRLLEVGCGEGAAARRLAVRLGLEVTGVDVDPEQIKLARSRSDGVDSVGFEVADARRLPFPDAAFDLVLCQRVTHHIPDWPRAIEEMLRVLRPAGTLVYVDFVLPSGLAAVTRRLPAAARLPDRERLEAIVRRHRLQVRQSSGWLSRTLVLSRPAQRRRA